MENGEVGLAFLVPFDVLDHLGKIIKKMQQNDVCNLTLLALARLATCPDCGLPQPAAPSTSPEYHGLGTGPARNSWWLSNINGAGKHGGRDTTCCSSQQRSVGNVVEKKLKAVGSSAYNKTCSIILGHPAPYIF